MIGLTFFSLLTTVRFRLLGWIQSAPLKSWNIIFSLFSTTVSVLYLYDCFLHSWTQIVCTVYNSSCPDWPVFVFHWIFSDLTTAQNFSFIIGRNFLSSAIYDYLLFNFCVSQEDTLIFHSPSHAYARAHTYIRTHTHRRGGACS